MAIVSVVPIADERPTQTQSVTAPAMNSSEDSDRTGELEETGSGSGSGSSGFITLWAMVAALLMRRRRYNVAAYDQEPYSDSKLTK